MIIQRPHPSERDLALLSRNDSERQQRDVPDFRDVTVMKPWGEEYLLFENEDTAIWILKIIPGGSTSMHAHRDKTTSLIVLGGRSNCETPDATHEFDALGAIILGKGVFHRSYNPASEPLYLLEIESPVDKFDLVRHQDSYGRQGTGYESQEGYQPTPDSYMATGSRRIGEVTVTIAFAVDRAAFLAHIDGLHDAIITILDRHVWTEDGEKLIEVGKSFKLGELDEFHINDRFHYCIIHRNEDRT